jgi:hypothetical protein
MSTTERDEVRTVLVHLNITVPAGDDRDANQIKDAILGALEVGADHETMHGLHIAVPLAEVVY